MSRKGKIISLTSERPTKTNIIIRAVIIIFGVLLSTIVAPLVSNQGLQLQQNIQNQQQADLQRLYGGQNPYYINMNQDFTFYLGMNGFIITYQAAELENGTGAPNNQVSFDGGLPINVNIVDNRLSVSANVTNREGQEIGTIKNNVWQSAINQSLINLYDINNNNFAFEVVDNNYAPLMQIRFFGLNEIDITGYFLTGEKGIVIVTDKSVYGEYPPNQLPENITLAPIFKYPSSKNQGELANVTMFLPNEKFSNSYVYWKFFGELLVPIGGIISTLFTVDIIWETFRSRKRQC